MLLKVVLLKRNVIGMKGNKEKQGRNFRRMRKA